MLLRFEREAGRDNGAVEVASVAAADGSRSAARLAAGRGKQFVTHRIVDHRDFSTTFDAYGDGNREVRQTFNEVGGAIQWIDNPLNILLFASVFTAFFGDNGVLRVRFANGFDNNRLWRLYRRWSQNHCCLSGWFLRCLAFRSVWQLN